MISDNDVKKLASLARLALSEENVKHYGRQINGILEYVTRLNEVNTDGIEPLSHVHGSTNILREDLIIKTTEPGEPALGESAIPKQGMLKIDDLLSNAPDSTGRFIKVPLIVE